MRTTIHPAADAYLISTNDRRLQAYCQHHPLLTGPDQSLNAEGLALLSAGPQIRRPTNPVEVKLLGPQDHAPPDEVVRRVRDMVAAIGQGLCDAPSLVDEYYWKVAAAPLAPTNILSIGCGNGEELIALRAVYPHARIVALDWENNLPPALTSVTQTEFRQSDLLEGWETRNGFDLVFSNHTLEHFYDPDAVLARLAGCLVEGGALVSAVPLDGDESDVFRSQLRAWARNPRATHWFDAGWIDSGHPWKTNASDVADTLHRAGFASVLLYQRAEHLTRELAMGDAALARFRREGGILNSTWRALCRLAAGAVGALTFGRSPQMLRKIMLGLDTRAPWGAMRLKNAQAPELMFTARRGRG